MHVALALLHAAVGVFEHPFSITSRRGADGVGALYIERTGTGNYVVNSGILNTCESGTPVTEEAACRAAASALGGTFLHVTNLDYAPGGCMQYDPGDYCTSNPGNTVCGFYLNTHVGSSRGAHFKVCESGGQPARLHIKGANWAGLQAGGCPHQLWSGNTVDQYIAFLVLHRFNAVRLPLSAWWVNENANVGSQCGAYSGQPALTVLDDLLVRLQRSRPFTRPPSLLTPLLVPHYTDKAAKRGHLCPPRYAHAH